MKKRLINLWKFLVSAILLILIFTTLVDTKALHHELQQARWYFLVLAAVLMILGTVLRAVRWDMRLRL